MAGGAAQRVASLPLPESLRAPVAMIGVFGFLAVTLGLYALSTNRDQTIEDARAETELLAQLLLEQATQLQGEDATALLAEAVLDTDGIRAATVWLGSADRVLAVGPAAPELSAEAAEAAVASVEPVVAQVDGSVTVAIAFARVEGAPVVLLTRTPLAPLALGWAGIAVAWLIVSVAILVTSFLLERGRRDRVMTLEETVQALYAHDALVTRQQQDLLRSKADFVSAISQELRSPLQVIKEVANLLARGGELSDQQRRDLVDGLQLNADRLDVLLGDLIDVDRLTQRTVAVNRRPVQVGAAVDAALQDIDTSRHRLRVDVDGVVANVTPGHIERILRCLLHNAVKYTPAGGTIEVAAVRSGDTVVLGVDDDGPGVPSSDRVTVFEPLRQLADDPGMGLGLALVKRFAELHGGRAWVEESEAGGAAFRVALPDEGAPVRVDPWRLADGAHVTDARAVTP